MNTITALRANQFIQLPQVNFRLVDVTLTAAQFKGMYATPVQIIPAPGANLMILIQTGFVEVEYGTTASGAGGDVILQYGATIHGAGPLAGDGLSAATLNAVTVHTIFGTPSAIFLTPVVQSTALNQGIYISNNTAPFTLTDSTYRVRIYYEVVEEQ